MSGRSRAPAARGAWALLVAVAATSLGPPVRAEVAEQGAWPRLELAQWDLAAGRAQQALEGSESAIAAWRESEGEDLLGAAHFHRGLALRQLGRQQEAHAALERAAALAPQLAADALLVRALDLLDEGRVQEAHALLRRAIEIDPASEAARRARLLLPRPRALDPARPYELEAYFGSSYDSNVTLDSGDPALGLPSDRDDFRLEWGAAGVWNLDREDWPVGLTLGARVDETWQFDFHEYDQIVPGAFAVLRIALARHVDLRVEGAALWSWLDGERFLESYSARPGLIVDWNGPAGFTRIFGDVEWRDYRERAFVEALERDQLALGAGLEQTFLLPLRDRLPGVRGASLVLGGRYTRQDVRADGFDDVDSDYDLDTGEGWVRLQAVLAGGLVLGTDLSVARELYRHDNLIGALTQGGERFERRDTYGELRVALERQLWGPLWIELRWIGSLRDSNVEVFDYDRQLAGIRFRTALH